MDDTRKSACFLSYLLFRWYPKPTVIYNSFRCDVVYGCVMESTMKLGNFRFWMNSIIPKIPKSEEVLNGKYPSKWQTQSRAKTNQELQYCNLVQTFYYAEHVENSRLNILSLVLQSQHISNQRWFVFRLLNFIKRMIDCWLNFTQKSSFLT